MSEIILHCPKGKRKGNTHARTYGVVLFREPQTKIDTDTEKSEAIKHESEDSTKE